MAPRFRIGIDLGGTKIEGVAVDGSGAVLLRRRIATPRGSYPATLEAMVALVGEIEMAIGETASVGLGMPGAISPVTGVVKNANSTWLIGRPLQQDLETKLGRPVRFANDANRFACRKRPTVRQLRWRRSSVSFSGPGWEAASLSAGGAASGGRGPRGGRGEPT